MGIRLFAIMMSQRSMALDTCYRMVTME